MAKNRAPIATGRNRRYVSNEEYRLSEIAKIKDPDGDDIKRIRIRLDGRGKGGYLYLNGRRLKTNRWYMVSAAEMQNLTFRARLRGRETVGSKLSVRAYDGKVWSATSSGTLRTVFNANRPRIRAEAVQKINADVIISGEDLFEFYDQDRNEVKILRFHDTSKGGGAFFFNGRQRNGVFSVRANKLDLVEYKTADGAARDVLRIRGSDGKYWSPWKKTRVVTIPRPEPRTIYDISTSDVVLDEQEVLTAQSLFEANDGTPNYELYEIYEATSNARTGQFYGPNSRFIPLQAREIHQFTASELMRTSFEGGKQELRSRDEIYSRVYNGKEWSRWNRFTISTEPRMIRSLASTSWLPYEDSRDPLVLTYSFATSPPPYYTDGDEANPLTFGSLTPALRAAARMQLNHLEKIINVRFVERPENEMGTITFGMTDNSDDGVIAWAYFPNAPETDVPAAPGDVWYNWIDWGSIWLAPDVGPGSEAYFISLHELGHAMGLSHPFGHADSLSRALDNNMLTNMAYNPHPDNNGLFGSTYQLYDIAALQSLYGANTQNQAGNDVYQYGTDARVFETIWDTGGVDEINVSNQVVGQTVDLRQGYSSSVSRHLDPFAGTVPSQNNLSIAYGVDIENATGSQFDDVIIGNHLANTLIGNNGNDRIESNQGNDHSIGGLGDDTYVYKIGDGDDQISENGGGLDVIQIQHFQSFTLSDLTFSRKGRNLTINLTLGENGGSEGTILVNDALGRNRVERLELYRGGTKLEATYDLTSIVINSKGAGQNFEASGVLGKFGMLANPVA